MRFKKYINTELDDEPLTSQYAKLGHYKPCVPNQISLYHGHIICLESTHLKFHINHHTAHIACSLPELVIKIIQNIKHTKYILNIAVKSNLCIAIDYDIHTEPIQVDLSLNIFVASHHKCKFILTESKGLLWLNLSLNLNINEQGAGDLELTTNKCQRLYCIVKTNLHDHAVCNIKGSSYIKNNQQQQILIDMNHLGDHSSSDVSWRVVTDDQSQFYLDSYGVNKNLSGVKIQQQLKGLNLSSYSKIILSPILDITSQCQIAQHGACVTQLNKDIIQYLNMRGVDTPIAQQALIKCFLKS